MGRVFKSELYSMAHSRLFWIVAALLIMFTVLTVSIGVAYHQPSERFYFLTGGRDPELEAAVYELDLMGGLENHLYYWEGRREYQLSPTAYAVISELPEYRYLLERGDFLHCYEIPPERYDIDESNIFEEWAVTGILSEFAGAAIASLFFAVFFFGRAHSHRRYIANAMFGVKRRDIVLGRLLVYLIACMGMIIIETVLSIVIYAPRVPELYGYAPILRGIVAQLTFGLFFCGIAFVFPVLIKKSVIAFFVSGFILTRSFTYSESISIFNMYYDAIDRTVTGEGFFTAYLPLLACTIAAFAVATAASVLYMQRARLK